MITHTVRKRAHGVGSLRAQSLLALALVALALVAPAAEGQQARTYAPKRWVRLWNVGGRMADTLFGSIREHVATPSAVYILDDGSLQVHALDAHTSQVLWSAGRKGGGPGEFSRPNDIALTVDGIAVLDQGNGRVTFFDANGQHVRDVSSAVMSNATALCVFSDGTLVVAQSRQASYLTHVRIDGKTIRTWDFPWEVPNGQPTVVRSTISIRGAAGAECHFAPIFGHGLVHVSSAGKLRTSSLLEKYPTPAFRTERGSNGLPRTMLESGTNASLGGMHWKDTIAVLAMTRSGNPAGADLYDVRSGRYLTSWRLPPDDRIARAGDMLFGLGSANITQNVRAWADTADTVRVMGAMQRAAKARSTTRATPPNRPDTPARRPTPAPARPPKIP